MLKERLKELRRRERISQKQLAEAIGVERSSIGKYEGNQNIIPSVDVLNAIADYFGVTTDYLLGRTAAYVLSPTPALILAESTDNYPAAFQRAEFEGLTQAEIDKLAIFAEGLKAGRTTEEPVKNELSDYPIKKPVDMADATPTGLVEHSGIEPLTF